MGTTRHTYQSTAQSELSPSIYSNTFSPFGMSDKDSFRFLGEWPHLFVHRNQVRPLPFSRRSSAAFLRCNSSRRQQRIGLSWHSRSRRVDLIYSAPFDQRIRLKGHAPETCTSNTSVATSPAPTVNSKPIPQVQSNAVCDWAISRDLAELVLPPVSE